MNADAKRGFYQRAASDAALLLLVGFEDPPANTRPRVERGWTDDLLSEQPKEDYFPRVALTFPADEVIAGPVGEIRVQVDIFVWLNDAALEAIDARLLELFDEKVWTYAGQRFYSRALGARDEDATPPLRRSRDYLIKVD
ncbi:MAG TPA: hypothetical protein VD838_21105 [Anaeromyxobacteraceae bacterium]|nr:hypothetical protein [Anaeromyxobacteraceae bacterium]